MAIEEVVIALNRLESDGLIASYAIGGAVAAQAYIAPMSTEDVDVFVVFSGDSANSLSPLQPIYANLIPRGAKISGPYLEIGGWPVQFLPAGAPLYTAAISDARSLPFGDVSARVMGPEYLAAIALQTGRGKDHLRLLEFINTGVLDESVFRNLVAHYGLSQKWSIFQAKFMEEP